MFDLPFKPFFPSKFSISTDAIVRQELVAAANAVNNFTQGAYDFEQAIVRLRQQLLSNVID